MTASRSQTVCQSLQLSIDTPSYNTQEVLISPESNSPSSSSARASVEIAGTTPASGGSEWTIYSVLCMYDFQSSDPDHLPFNKNEILDIVKQEETGWWAAMRKGGEVIGWIPQAFVKPLSKEMTERLRNVREELRVYEYDAEQLYNSAPISRLHQLYESDPEASPTPNPGGWNDEGANVRKRTAHPVYLPITDQTPSTQPITPTDHARDLSQSVPPSAPGPGLYLTPPDSQRSTGDNRPRPYPPPSPSTPMPQPPLYTAPINKPTPPTPTDSHETLQRSHCESSSPGLANGRSIRRRPMLVDDRVSLSRLSTMMESSNMTEVDKLASPDSTGSFDALTRRSRAEKIKQITGSEDALAFHNAVQAQASLPMYLRPSYSDQLQVDNEGQVRFGTLPALIEKLSSDTLTKDPIKMAQETTFRNIFLMTFRNFTSADQLFDMLVERYRMDHPSGMTSAEFEEWKEKCLLPTQGRVLTVFTIWLEDHRLLEEEPQIAQRLTDFLALIVTPPPFALTAKLIVQSIERLTFANPINPSPTVSARRRRKSRAHKNDLLRLDPTDIAEQLCLLEYKLYAKVTPQECITYAKTQTGKSVANLCAFCSTHDKLASWVKTSILNNEALGKRADTVDFWIKVAEKCRNLNNFASMSALINALSSTVITRLHLTWAHVGRKSNLDALLKYNEPTGGFSGYRSLLLNVEGSCVPFIGMYLTDIVHIQDQFSDDGPLLCFLQRHRLYEVVTVMLRYQSRPYNIAESESMQNFVSAHLHAGSLKEQGWFWTRSQEVQQSELAHADIRKGLEAAGF